MPRAWLPLVPVAAEDPAQTSRVYRFADGVGEIGFINPVSEPFCDACDRLRLTAEGTLRTCLFSQTETDLRGPMRAGASDEDLVETGARRSLEQGAEAPHRRCRVPAAAAQHEPDRRLRALWFSQGRSCCTSVVLHD